MGFLLNVSAWRRLIYSHHVFSGIRHAVCVVLAYGVVFGAMNSASAGLIAGLGASCVAIIDQGGPSLKQRIREMLWGVVLGGITVAVTGFATSSPMILTLVVMALCFSLSMLQSFGPRGGFISLACLLLMTITMHTELSVFETTIHVLITVIGSILYVVSSLLLGRLLQIPEQEQALTAALLKTSDYVAQRGLMYDPQTDLDEGYSDLIQKQSSMITSHQAVRDMLLASINERKLNRSTHRRMTWNVFVDMVSLLDLFLGTQTDYKLLHKALGPSDILVFMRDALLKNAHELERIAVAVTQGTHVNHDSYPISTKAELRALDYEIERLVKNGFDQREPEAFLICQKVLRRLNRIQGVLSRMRSQIGKNKPMAVLELDHLKHLPPEILTHYDYRVALLKDNLRWSSSVFRFALRLTVALGAGMVVAMLFPSLQHHSYWMLISILVIMRPAFSITSQRNTGRLWGTVAGCIATFVLLSLTQDSTLLSIALLLSLLIGFAMTIVNFTFSTLFMTVAVLLGLHFMLPNSYHLASDRAIETVVGSLIAFVCSFLFPWWESKSIPKFAHSAQKANADYLEGIVNWLKAHRTLIRSQPNTLTAHTPDTTTPNVHSPNSNSNPNPNPTHLKPEDDLMWHLGRKKVFLALSQFTDSLTRMMKEPKVKQRHLAEFNNLLIENHTLASRASTLIEMLYPLPNVPLRLLGFLSTMVQAIRTNDLDLVATPLPDELEAEMKLAGLNYWLNQLRVSIQHIILETKTIEPHVL